MSSMLCEQFFSAYYLLASTRDLAYSTSSQYPPLLCEIDAKSYE